ncbi:hypothetical protein OH738_39035 [Streptomyces hirsutus]|uniref:hypothetical protein n=1 Tax=Streptomyces TaxID=1883 RepID=UPI00386A8E0A|nr:hypothetical protein OH738_39035 [Streptomyces hirsutus]WTD72781.1 hypothetical protein OHB56_01435 [Streptomyces sp. NBC_01635]
MRAQHRGWAHSLRTALPAAPARTDRAAVEVYLYEQLGEKIKKFHCVMFRDRMVIPAVREARRPVRTCCCTIQVGLVETAASSEHNEIRYTLWVADNPVP